MTNEWQRAFDAGRRMGRVEGLTEAAHQHEREAIINQGLANLHRDDPEPTVWFEYADLHRRWAGVMHDLARTESVHITAAQHAVLSDAMVASVKFIDHPREPTPCVGDDSSMTYDAMVEWLGYMGQRASMDPQMYGVIATGIQRLRAELENRT